jgi:CRISPR type III-associated protein (TIGR04423 family)
MNGIGKYSKLGGLSEIPALQYTGWVWMSDSSEPNQVCGSLDDLETYEFKNGKEPVPFIVEARLFAETEKTSIAVKAVDGGYHIGMIDWTHEGNGETTVQSFLAVPVIGKKIRMKTAWIPEPDNLCEGFPVLQPAWSGFIGFEEEESLKND